MTTTSIANAINEIPSPTAGVNMGQGDSWRFAVQILVAERANRVGKARVDNTRVGSNYEWLDLTPDLTSCSVSIGGSSGTGFPSPNVGVMNLSLFRPDSDEDYTYSELNTDSTRLVGGANIEGLNREFGIGAIIRATSFTDTASGRGGILGDCPIFTGIVEEWKETLTFGGSQIEITVVDTLSLLAGIDELESASAGAGEVLYVRLQRLLNAANWKFDFNTVWEASEDVSVSGGFLLQATTMAGNRLSELRLTLASMADGLVTCAPDGRLNYGFPADITLGNPITSNARMPQFTSTTEVVPGDAANFPNAVIGYYSPPLELTSQRGGVLNDFSFARVGGTAVNSRDAHSIGLYGVSSLKRYDLICTTDAAATTAMNRAVKRSSMTRGVGLSQCTRTDQSIQPGRITITDQHDCQRAIALHRFAILDYVQDLPPADISYEKVRFLGRLTSINHLFVRTSTGIVWTSDVSMFSQFNYYPT